MAGIERLAEKLGTDPTSVIIAAVVVVVGGLLCLPPVVSVLVNALGWAWLYPRVW